MLNLSKFHDPHCWTNRFDMINTRANLTAILCGYFQIFILSKSKNNNIIAIDFPWLIFVSFFLRFPKILFKKQNFFSSNLVCTLGDIVHEVNYHLNCCPSIGVESIWFRKKRESEYWHVANPLFILFNVVIQRIKHFDSYLKKNSTNKIFTKHYTMYTHFFWFISG